MKTILTTIIMILLLAVSFLIHSFKEKEIVDLKNKIMRLEAEIERQQAFIQAQMRVIDIYVGDPLIDSSWYHFWGYGDLFAALMEDVDENY